MKNILPKRENASPQETSPELRCVGVNIGAISVTVVALRGDEVLSGVKNHQGRPLEALGELLAGAEFARAE